MPTILRALFVLALLVMSGTANADQDVSAFVAAVEEKLSRLASYSAPPDISASGGTSEQIVLVDVTSDGLVLKVQDQPPVTDLNASAKFQRVVLMASPFPRLPAVLTKDYSIIRLAIAYIVAPGKDPFVERVEVKGGLRYVEF
jgi:hypothetical protein